MPRLGQNERPELSSPRGALHKTGDYVPQAAILCTMIVCQNRAQDGSLWHIVPCLVECQKK